MSKEIDTKIECCEIWNSLKDKTKMIDFLINAKTEIDQLKQENETLFLQLSKQEIDEHKPVYCTLAGNDCKYLGKIKQLKQQLSEKDKEIERLKNLFELNNEVVINQGKEIFDLRVQVLQQKQILQQKQKQNQTQLAIQELEKVKNYCDKQFNLWENNNFNETYDNTDVSQAYFDISCAIQDKIQELKGE